MSRTVTILMLGGAKRVSLARLFCEAGRQVGVDVCIVSYEIVPTVPIASVGRVVIGRKWRDADVCAHLAETVDRYGVDIVLPFVDGAVEVAARLKSLLDERVFVPVSSERLSHAMFDKAEAAQLFEREGFAIPRTCKAGAACAYPVILKPREGSASKGIIVARSADEMPEQIDGYLIQEYIADREEYTVDCYVSAISGEILCTVPRIRLSTSGGEVDRTCTRRIPELVEASRHILSRLGFSGPVTLQFIYDKKARRYLLMEINPRLGGGVVCSVRAGADFPRMILDEASGKAGTPCDDWRDNALMARYFDEVMFYE